MRVRTRIRAKWYLNDVRKKQNRSWPREDKLKVLKLSHYYTAKEVADIFNTSESIINNVKRIAKKSLSKCCFTCGRPLTKDEIAKAKNKFSIPCKDCKKRLMEYKRERRQKALKKGLCGYCEKMPVLPGHTGCKKCISSTQRRRNKDGLCGTCGKRPVMYPNGAVCKVCSKTVAKQHQTIA